ncbi:hypothetical protein P6O24_11440 [Clostridium perfringens]|nr:hypothetical protein [Clostridium perfringens]MDK0878533.1 hypothetical protein [Clostridium perfringens]MDK0888498.1 hypothetical protein [Clostridium perfringens]MDK0892245.1 hypothetical protein [Clostridium perfringens]MDM0947818.1 hypothetical protein [Clostridium perfringens]
MNKENNKYKRKYDDYISFGEVKPVIFLPTPDAKEGIISYYGHVKNDLKKYLNVIFKEEYFYTKKKISSIFDFNNQFVQKFMVTNFKALFITKDVKNAIKTIDYIHNKAIDLDLNEDFELYYSTVQFIERVPDYNSVLFYKKADIIDWIFKSSFQKEIIVTNADGFVGVKKVNVTDEDINLIFEKGLKSNKTIGEYKGLKHPMQISRHIKAELAAERYVKYTFINKHDKNKTNKENIRYMIMY